MIKKIDIYHVKWLLDAFFLILLNKKKEFNTFLDREMICDFFYIILNFVSVFKKEHRHIQKYF